MNHPVLPPLSPDDTALLYPVIADTIPHIVWSAQPDGRVDYHNARAFEYAAEDPAKLEGRDWRALVHPDDLEPCARSWTEALASGDAYSVQCRLRRGKGQTWRWHLVRALPLRDGAGRILRWVGTCTDIDSQKLAAERLEAALEERSRALRESDERFRHLSELSIDVHWETDSEHRLTLLEFGGLLRPPSNPASQLGRKRWEIPYESPDAEGWRAHAVILDARLPFRNFEFSRPAADGVRHYSIGGEPVYDAQGEFTGYRGVGHEITAQKRAEAALRESAERIRSLLRRLVAAQESERRRFSADLHDLVGQNLSAIGILLETLRGKLSPERAAENACEFQELARLLGETVAAVRQMMADLRPELLDDYGLLPALQGYAPQFERRTGLRVVVEGEEIRPRPAPEAELALFRIAQEALTNAVKHANASRVCVALSHANGAVRLVVEDDGTGFRQPAGARAARRGGWGLPIMRERAESVAGTLHVEFPGVGTRVVVEVPHGDPHHRG